MNATPETLNIIHLPERADRYQLLMQQLQGQEIRKYNLWAGEIVRKSRKTGICRSHKRIVDWARSMELDKIIIAEDDIRFFGEGAWKFYLSNTPNSYDLYFGMVYRGLFDDNYRIYTQCSGMTLYTIHKRFYDTFLSIPDDVHIDRHITTSSANHEFMVCPKFVCEQNGTKSDNNLRVCDYKPLLRNRVLFG